MNDRFGPAGVLDIEIQVPKIPPAAPIAQPIIPTHKPTELASNII